MVFFKTLLSRVSWYEWILLGVILVLGTMLYFKGNQVNTLTKDKVNLQRDIGDLNTTVEITTDALENNNTTYEDYIDRITDSRSIFEKSRKEFNNAYYLLVDQQTPEQSTSTSDTLPTQQAPIEEPGCDTPPQIYPDVKSPQSVQTPPPSNANDVARVALIASSLHEAYCRATTVCLPDAADKAD